MKRISNNQDEVEVYSDSGITAENPAALYENVMFPHPPQTLYEALQQWSHRHKRKLYALLLLTIVSSLFVGLRSSTPDSPEKLMRQYFGRFNGHADDWQYSIEGFHFTRAHLDALFPVIARFTLGHRGALETLRDKSTRELFARDQFETDLLVYAAMQEGILDQADAKSVLENSMRHAIADYYVQKKLESGNADYRGSVGDAEALAYYEKNQELYAKNGVAKAPAIEMIRTILSSLKRETHRQQMRVDRAKLIQVLQERFGPRFREGKE
ncbi:MAG: hypothetical protein JNM27_19070 [Leptospirales bacterium]|nr:hypothetical protein [Leptospirales bacterium]